MGVDRGYESNHERLLRLRENVHGLTGLSNRQLRKHAIATQLHDVVELLDYLLSAWADFDAFASMMSSRPMVKLDSHDWGRLFGREEEEKDGEKPKEKTLGHYLDSGRQYL